MSAEAGANEVEKEMEGTNVALDSSPPLPQEQDHLPSGDPLLPHLVPLPGSAAGGEKKLASPRLAPWTGPKASDPPLDTGLLRKSQMLQDLAQ